MNYIDAMTDEDWAKCLVLKKDGSNWGDPNGMARSVVMELDRMLADIKLPAQITYANCGEHVEGSYHYPVDTRPCLAIDFMFPTKKLKDIPDLLFEILRYNFTGIGIYNGWKLAKDEPCIGGFHVDTRPTNRKALWLRSGQIYTALTFEEMVKLF